MIVENRKTVSGFELIKNIARRQNRQTCDIDLVTRCKNNLIARNRLTVAESHIYLAVVFYALNDLRSRPHMHAIVVETCFEPRLDFQSSLGPKSVIDVVLLSLRQAPKPAWIAAHRVHDGVHP